MNEKPTRTEYARTLTNIRKAAETEPLASILDIRLSGGGFDLHTLRIDEQDPQWEAVGLRKVGDKKVTYFYQKKGGEIVNRSVEDTADLLCSRYDSGFFGLTPELTKKAFANAISEPYKSYLMEQAEIEFKVARFRKELEERL